MPCARSQGRIVAIGPHGSSTPRATLQKLEADVVVMGESEEVLPQLAGHSWHDVPAIAFDDGHEVRVNGGPHYGRFVDLPPLAWPDSWIARHIHHHHRFDAEPARPGAEVEASRGCPYHCSFCAKEMFRDRYRRRALPAVLEEIDRLIGQGVEYVYFIDEIFLPNRPLLEALALREVRFGVQTRIDLWKPEMLELLGARRLRLDRGGRREHHARRPGRARQGLPDEHRRARRAPDVRQAARGVRPGQHDQLGAR